MRSWIIRCRSRSRVDCARKRRRKCRRNSKRKTNESSRKNLKPLILVSIHHRYQIALLPRYLPKVSKFKRFIHGFISYLNSTIEQILVCPYQATRTSRVRMWLASRLSTASQTICMRTMRRRLCPPRATNTKSKSPASTLTTTLTIWKTFWRTDTTRPTTICLHWTISQSSGPQTLHSRILFYFITNYVINHIL